VDDIFYYGYKLQRMKKYKEALTAFKAGYERDPKGWLANFGMARGSAGIGDKASALKYMDLSIQLVNDPGTKGYLQRVKQGISDGKEISGL
jgi:hypothetical protein